MPSLPFDVELVDGSTVTLRAITPDDKQLLRDGLARMSPESRYFRFFSPVDHLSDAQLRYFTEVDQVDHVALGAVHRGGRGEIGIGVARYIRMANDPAEAEAAVAVADDFHRLGIGTLLLDAVAALAINNGIRRFRLLVRRENLSMIELLERLDARVAPCDEPSTLAFVLDLPALAHDLRGTPMWQVFRAISSGHATGHIALGNHGNPRGAV